MRILRRKSDVVLPVTEQDEKQSVKVEFTKAMEKNLTTWDIIGLVVLTAFLPVLFHAPQTDDDNPHGRVDK